VPNTQNVAWILTHYGAGQLQLDPPFQRRSVWNLDYQRSFIDTVLRDYPCPPIFLEEDTEPGRPTIWNVIDGKQRISALIAFSENEFHLGRYLAEDGHPDAYWDDLPMELQRRFSRYRVTVENITDTSEAELREAFNRLNRNVDRLTAQELRHAQFPGLFLDRMEALSEDPFWADRRIASPANIRRMRDVEFVSELFLLTMHGVLDGKSEILDAYYAAYAEEIPDEDEHRATYDAILTYLKRLPLDWRETRWANMGDLYSLWGALSELYGEEDELPEPEIAAQRLTRFSAQQRELVEASRERNPLPGDDADRRYFDAIRQGVSKDANRAERIRILQELLA
jgi:Protein of unknown function DUF262